MGRCRTTIRESGTLFLSVFIRVIRGSKLFLYLLY